jgi:hypothetical protein
MLSLKPGVIRGEIEAMINRTRTIDVEESSILSFAQLGIGHSLSQVELAARDVNEVQQAFESNSEGLLGYVRDKGECVMLEMDAGDKLKRAAIFTIVEIELANVWCVRDMVFLDRTRMQDLSSCMVRPIMLITNEKA